MLYIDECSMLPPKKKGTSQKHTGITQ